MPDPNTAKRRYVVGTNLDGHEIVDDETGRPLRTYTGEFSAQAASGGCRRLNDAAAKGPQALARALGAW